ncbi:MAG: hypothetical protein AAFV69_05345, partial [Pseudomonadota bacterium]
MTDPIPSGSISILSTRIRAPAASMAAVTAILVSFSATIVEATPSLKPDTPPGANERAKTSKTAEPTSETRPTPAKPDQPVTMDQFLDRLMIAESDGRLTAKNPLSSALGPFQFIKSTWLDVMKRHFPKLAEKSSRIELLALRTDMKTARQAAGAYTRDLSAALQRANLKDTFVNLRLAYLLGPSASVRVLQAKDEQRVATLISRAAL